MQFTQEEKEFATRLNPDRIPAHVAIIMDGNRRWAKNNKLPIFKGHQVGTEVLRKILRLCDYIKLKYLTIFSFSSENWSRKTEEVNFIFRIMEEFARFIKPELKEFGVQVHFLGDLEEVPKSLQKELDITREETKNNSNIILQVALNYSGRNEIIKATKEICRQVQDGRLTIDQITEASFPRYLFTRGIPDPDLLIRSSGEQRISNFLLWQIAYTELWYTPHLWPEFTCIDFMQAILDYQQRERRFGGGY